MSGPARRRRFLDMTISDERAGCPPIPNPHPPGERSTVARGGAQLCAGFVPNFAPAGANEREER
jgi:hypothetical protein